jgi:hypothetical protein
VTVGKGMLSTRSVQSGYEEDNWGTQLVEGCQLTESSALEAVNIGPERVKLTNLYC